MANLVDVDIGGTEFAMSPWYAMDPEMQSTMGTVLEKKVK